MDKSKCHIAWKDGHPYSPEFEDIYYPPEDGIGAAYHVFIQSQGLEERIKRSNHLALGELGFGTGLNLLTLLSCWRKIAAAADLTFVSCEKYPLSPSDLEQALSKFPELKDEASLLIEHYPYRTEGFHSIRLYEGRVHIILLFGDAAEQLKELDGTIDAWFLDGFNPKHNPELWTEDIFHLLASLSHRDTTLATWSVSGMVRRNLEKAGISWEKIPGFGKKKQALLGTFKSFSEKKSMDQLFDKKIAILGAGIAGSSLSYALRNTSCQLNLYDAHEGPAGGASGNRYGLLVPYVTQKKTPLHELYVNGYRRTLSAVQDLCTEGHELDWHQSGALHMPVTKRLSTLLESLKTSPMDERLLRSLNKEEASTLAGVSIEEDCFFYRDAGYLHPPSLCTALQKKNSSLQSFWNVNIADIESKSSGIFLGGNQTLEGENFDLVFLCTAWNTHSLSAAKDILTNQVRGQLLSSVSETEVSKHLKTLLCYNGYCTPAHKNRHCLGVSYERSTDDSFSMNEQLEILSKLHLQFPSLSLSNVEDTRVSFRATTYDRMPIVGPLPERSALEALLEKEGVSSDIYTHAGVQGVSVFTGLGSRGLISSILLSEYLVDSLRGRPIGISKSLRKALHPARLIVRAWKNR